MKLIRAFKTAFAGRPVTVVLPSIYRQLDEHEKRALGKAFKDTGKAFTTF
jgi:hypothetical protein